MTIHTRQTILGEGQIRILTRKEFEITCKHDAVEKVEYNGKANDMIGAEWYTVSTDEKDYEIYVVEV